MITSAGYDKGFGVVAAVAAVAAFRQRLATLEARISVKFPIFF